MEPARGERDQRNTGDPLDRSSPLRSEKEIVVEWKSEGLTIPEKSLKEDRGKKPWFCEVLVKKKRDWRLT